MNERKRRKKQVLKQTVKCTAVAAVAITMALQPCFAFTAHAYTAGYDNNYPTHDDPGYRGSYYWDESENRKVSNVSRTFDDGTKYSAQYKYNEAGYLVYSDVKDEKGNKYTYNISYNGDTVISQSIYAYDASTKTEETQAVEYRENGEIAHSLETAKREGSNKESIEKWFLSEGNPLKSLSVMADGSTAQTDYTYNEYGRPLTCTTTQSNGDIEHEEWHYDEAGEVLGKLEYEYTAKSQWKETTERYYETEGNSENIYVINTVVIEGVPFLKRENWHKDNGYTPVKEVVTYFDGTQSTENYEYSADGEETRYTKVNFDGTTSTRETTYTRDGRRTVESDSAGNTKTTSIEYNESTEQYISEITDTKADGSSSYEKYISDTRYGYGASYTIMREITAGGVETYTESTTEADGSSTTKEKTADGTVTVIKRDSSGNRISAESTSPDGLKAETTETRSEDGRLTSEVTRYSDGSVDRTDYEYDASGYLVKETETRKSGVSAVTVIQYNETNKNSYTYTTTFNNGLQYVQSVEELDEYRDHIVITYSGGEVVQDIYTDTTDESVFIKTIYRDGRTEEVTLNTATYEERGLLYEKVDVINERYRSFLDQAWAMLPAQPTV